MYCRPGRACYQLGEDGRPVVPTMCDAPATLEDSPSDKKASIFPVADILDTWFSSLTFRNHTFTVANASLIPQLYAWKIWDPSPPAYFETICLSNGDALHDSTTWWPFCLPEEHFVGVEGYYATKTDDERFPTSTEVAQTNNYDKYDQIYMGGVNASQGDFSSSVKLSGSGGGLVVAQKIRFVLVRGFTYVGPLAQFWPANWGFGAS